MTEAQFIDMPSGHISNEELPEEVRILRHNLNNVRQQVVALNDIVKESFADIKARQQAHWELSQTNVNNVSLANRSAGEARLLVEKAMEQISDLDQAIFGSDKYKDPGRLGRLEAAVEGLKKQSWAILTMLLTGMIALVVDLVSTHLGH